jgi:hypothetical protein
MSAVLDAIEGNHATWPVERVTRESSGARSDLHWHYDLLNSRRFPVQYYATALRGSGPDADEVLVIGIECFESDAGPLIVTARITGEEGVILAEGPSIEIDMPSQSALLADPDKVVREITAQIQAAFARGVDWVNTQRATIERALEEA